MSNTKSNESFTCPKELFSLPVSMTAKMVFAALCNERDTNGNMTPAYHRLAAIARVNERTVKKAIKQLHNNGAIFKFPRYAASGAQLTNKYLIHAFGDVLDNDADFYTIIVKARLFIRQFGGMPAKFRSRRNLTENLLQ